MNSIASQSEVQTGRLGITGNNPGRNVNYDRYLDCIHCGLCLSACPTYEELGTEMDSPRGRIYLMRAVTDGRLPADATVRSHLDSCLNCRACETACPSGVKYHQILEPFREALADDGLTAKPLPWMQRFALRNVFPYRGRSRWALAPVRLLQRIGLASLIRRLRIDKLLSKSSRNIYDMLPDLAWHYGRLPEFLPAEGPRRATVALFLGCVGDAVFPHTNVATARILQRNGCDVWIPRRQSCCGALDFHDHAVPRARQFATNNLQEFGFIGSSRDVPDAIITNAAGCGAMLKDYGQLFADGEHSKAATVFANKVQDISKFLSDLGPIKPTHPVRLKAAYHDACHLRHAQQVFSEPRRLLQMVPGLELVALPESEYCCGAAGSYNLTQPEMAERLGWRKAEHILATGADAAITGNVGCLLQIGKFVRQRNPHFRVLHPADVLFAAYFGEGLK